MWFYTPSLWLVPLSPYDPPPHWSQRESHSPRYYLWDGRQTFVLLTHPPKYADTVGCSVCSRLRIRVCQQSREVSSTRRKWGAVSRSCVPTRVLWYKLLYAVSSWNWETGSKIKLRCSRANFLHFSCRAVCKQGDSLPSVSIRRAMTGQLPRHSAVSSRLS